MKLRVFALGLPLLAGVAGHLIPAEHTSFQQIDRRGRDRTGGHNSQGLYNLIHSLPKPRPAPKHVRPQDYNEGEPIEFTNRFLRHTPHGAGLRGDQKIEWIMNLNEIESAMQSLRRKYKIGVFTTPYKTLEGRSIVGGLVGGSAQNQEDSDCADTPRVFLTGGMSGRERGTPDAVLYFISDLLLAKMDKTGLKYGNRNYTNSEVLLALSNGIVFIPMLNPDGVNHDHSTNSCWRKNSAGVDINRNFDFLWDYKKAFHPMVIERLPVASSGAVASEDPELLSYHGTAPFSEPESRSVKWVLDTYKHVGYYADLRTTGRHVLYNWGDDENQSNDPDMNFANSLWDRTRGLAGHTPVGVNPYGEYMPEPHAILKDAFASRMAANMKNSTGRGYQRMPASKLNPISGTAMDYAYSRHFLNASLSVVHGFSLNVGRASGRTMCPSYPPNAAEHTKNMIEAAVGFMELLLASAENHQCGHRSKSSSSDKKPLVEAA